MEENKKSAYSFKEPIIEYSIAGVILIAWIVLIIITGFYIGYLLILLIPAFFIIDGIVTHKKILNYKKQELERNTSTDDSSLDEKQN